MNTEQRIKYLEDTVAKLVIMLSNDGMPFDLRANIANQVVKGEDTQVPTTRTVAIIDFPTQLPVNPAGTIIITKNGKEYAVPYLTR